MYMTWHIKYFTLYMISFFLVVNSVSQDKVIRLETPVQVRVTDMCDIKAQPVWIIVHGTYANGAKWYQPKGDFYEALKAVLPSNAQVHSFSWSGKYSHDARVKAAHQLVHFVEQQARPEDIIHIVGHSHGGTVAVLAARFFKDKKSSYHITQLFTLAPPVYKTSYTPDMENIDYLYNIFSFGDLVQSLFGLSERVYTQHAQIWNIELKKDGLHPDHSDLHSPEVGALIPFLQELVKGNDTTVMHLQSGKEHLFEEDFDRPKLLEMDQRANQDLLRVSIESMRRRYPQKLLLKVMRVSRERFNKRLKDFLVYRWYKRYRNRN